MSDPDLASEVRRATSALLFDPAACVPAVDHDRPMIERLLRHRGPMLLLDRVVAVDPVAATAVATRRVAPDDPIFAGHFPGRPTYPMHLRLEMMGQLGFCLRYFAAHRTTTVRADARPAQVRLLRVHAAAEVADVRPGADLLVLARLAEDSGQTVVALGQILERVTEPHDGAGRDDRPHRGGRIVAACATEAFYAESR